MKNALVKRENVSDVSSQVVEVLEVNVDATSYARLGWMIVLFGVIGFLVWASFAPLDKGVPMGGTVAVSGNRKLVQHLVGGTIDSVLVKEGDVVKAGQVLVRMNPTNAKASVEIARVQLVTAQATEARLKAERDGARSIVFPASLEQAKNDPRVAANIQLQQQLFATRTLAQQSDLAAIDENVAGLKSQLKGLEESMITKKQQQGFLKEQLDSVRELSKEGYVARNRLLDLERTYAQVNGGISEDFGNMGRVTRQISESNLRRQQRQQEYQKEIRSQLSDIQKEAESVQSRLQALEYELNNVDVKASVDGTVVAMNLFTAGAVVPPGAKLMELVASGEKLIVEGQLPVHLIDKVHRDLEVELIFSAFNSNTTPHIAGKVALVSADRTVDERTGQAYYKVKVEVTPEGNKQLGALTIRPGMPVEMVVKTGPRTMMNYLLKPITDRVHSSLREE